MSKRYRCECLGSSSHKNNIHWQGQDQTAFKTRVTSRSYSSHGYDCLSWLKWSWQKGEFVGVVTTPCETLAPALDKLLAKAEREKSIGAMVPLY